MAADSVPKLLAAAGAGAALYAVGWPLVRRMLASGGGLAGARGKPTVLSVVLTGGPCAGKSSSLDAIRRATAERGWACYSVPEVPTIMLEGGLKFPQDDEDQLVAFEEELLKLQIAAEDVWTNVARSTGKNSVVVLDRGAMDVKAYLPPHLWGRVLRGVGVTEGQLSSRYDMVIHLTTAAYGAEKFYTVANNTVRRETPAMARDMDDKVREAWEGFEGHVVIRNDTDMEGKIDKVKRHILSLIKGQAV